MNLHLRFIVQYQRLLKFPGCHSVTCKRSQSSPHNATKDQLRRDAAKVPRHHWLRLHMTSSVLSVHAAFVCKLGTLYGDEPPVQYIKRAVLISTNIAVVFIWERGGDRMQVDFGREHSTHTWRHS